MRTAILLLLIASAGACTTVRTPTFSDDEGAIRGYDPVAYFDEGRPIKGEPDLSYEYQSATWHFSSTENRDRFVEAPERFAPQYGGYCAYAMSKGFFVSTDPDAWHIHDHKLYLNYSLRVRRTWLKDVPGYIGRADMSWLDKMGR